LSSKEEFLVPDSIKNKEIRELVKDCTRHDPKLRIDIGTANKKLKSILFNMIIQLSKKTTINKLYSSEKESKKLF